VSTILSPLDSEFLTGLARGAGLAGPRTYTPSEISGETCGRTLMGSSITHTHGIHDVMGLRDMLNTKADITSIHAHTPDLSHLERRLEELSSRVVEISDENRRLRSRIAALEELEGAVSHHFEGQF